MNIALKQKSAHEFTLKAGGPVTYSLWVDAKTKASELGDALGQVGLTWQEYAAALAVLCTTSRDERREAADHLGIEFWEMQE